MSPIRTKTFILPRRMLMTALGMLALTAMAVYMLFQARFLIQGPRVTLISEPGIIQHERQITLEGVAVNITAISVNGRPIVTSEVGVFKEPIVLENGYTVVRIDARDRFGRTTSLERPFVYVDPAPAITLQVR